MWSESVARRWPASLAERLLGRVEHVGEGALARAADAAADLVGLREPELVGALDDQRVRLRDVEPRLDDRRRHQAVGVAAQEAEHRLLELGLVHLPVRLGEAHPRAERAQPLGDLVQGVDPVVEEEHLALARGLALDRPRRPAPRRRARRRCAPGAGPRAASRSPRCRAGRRGSSAACAGSASPRARARRPSASAGAGAPSA